MLILIFVTSQFVNLRRHFSRLHLPYTLWLCHTPDVIFRDSMTERNANQFSIFTWELFFFQQNGLGYHNIDKIYHSFTDEMFSSRLRLNTLIDLTLFFSNVRLRIIAPLYNKDVTNCSFSIQPFKHDYYQLNGGYFELTSFFRFSSHSKSFDLNISNNMNAVLLQCCGSLDRFAERKTIPM